MGIVRIDAEGVLVADEAGIVGAVGTGATLVGVAVAAFLLALVFVLNRDIRDLRIDDPVALPELNNPAG